MTIQQSIALPLACAAGALLGHAPAVAQTSEPGWSLDSALLFYSETDRVSAIEPVVSLTRRTEAGNAFTLKGVVDVLTGASATGAVSTDTAQTFTRPSGNGSYTIAPGATPLDDTFHDTRGAISADWEAGISRTLRYGLGANLSSEFDYQSVGISGRLMQDFNQKNTTLSVGLAQAQDTIKPVGGVPEALRTASLADYDRREGSDSKSVTDLLIGITQIVDSRSFVQFNYGLTASSGYHTDPYKVVSVVGADGRPVAGGGASSVFYEKRPDSRNRHSLFGRYRRLLESGNIVETSYRFTTDDWGILTHTLDTRYRIVFDDAHYVQARFRYYTQGAADFYRPFVRDGATTGDFASADYRLADMNAFTVGLEYRFGSRDRPWRVALEYYLQQAKEPGDKFGELANQELAPPVSAIMFRINKSF